MAMPAVFFDDPSFAGDGLRFSDVEEPLAARAEAMVAATRRKSRRHRRGGKAWTDDDEMLFRARLADLYEARTRLLRACPGRA